jgi:hypothetical protein
MGDIDLDLNIDLIRIIEITLDLNLLINRKLQSINPLQLVRRLRRAAAPPHPPTF